MGLSQTHSRARLDARRSLARRAAGESTAIRRVGIAALVVVAYVALAVSRRPESFTSPQFYAEDGQWWYAGAHNASPLHLLFTPLGGYLIVFQGLVAALCAPLGLTHAALAYAVVATILQVAPALMFASARMRTAVPNDAARVVIGAIYLLIPNSELSGNLTNTQWHLAMLAFLVLCAAPPRRRWARVFDLGVLLLCGLTGPYALLLFPLGLVMHRAHLDHRRRIQLAVLLMTALVQLGLLIASLPAGSRATSSLGVSAANFLSIIANQAVWRFAPVSIAPTATLLAAAVSALVFALLVAGLVRGSAPLRYFIVFAVAIAAAGLLVPYRFLKASQPVWDSISNNQGESRYFFLMSVALALAAITLAGRIRIRGSDRAVGAVVLLGLLVAGAVSEWRYVPLPDEHLSAYQARLDKAPNGSTVTIPIDPQGWSMRVVAH